MADEKDRYGETMRLVERAKEDIYFAERERELMAKLKGKLRPGAPRETKLRCPKCPGELESYFFEGFPLDRCRECGGVWMDQGELEGVIRKISRGPLGAWIDKLTAKDKDKAKEGAAT